MILSIGLRRLVSEWAKRKRKFWQASDLPNKKYNPTPKWRWVFLCLFLSHVSLSIGLYKIFVHPTRT
jgi:hypothetical protein